MEKLNNSQILLSKKISRFLILISSIIILLGSIGVISATFSFYNIRHINNTFLEVLKSVREIQNTSASLSLKYSLIANDHVESPLSMLKSIHQDEKQMIYQLDRLEQLLNQNHSSDELQSIIGYCTQLKKHILSSKADFENLSIALIEEDLLAVKKYEMDVGRAKSQFQQLVFKISSEVGDSFSNHVTQMNKVTIIIFVSTLLIVTLSIFTALFATNNLIKHSKKIILKPLGLFENASHKIADGDFEGKINPEEAGELSGFARKFNEMKDKIADYQLQLSLFNTALDRVAALVVLNSDRTIKQFNQKFTDLNGSTVIVTEGILFSSLSCNQSESFNDACKSMREGNSWQGELLFYKSEKEIVWTDTVIIPVEYHEKNQLVKNFIIISFDITEKKRTEQQLQDREQQLQITNRLSALGELSSGIAHEINNPLVIISSTTSVLKKLFMKDRLTEDKVDKYMSDINTMVTRISKVTHGLKMLAQKDIHSESEVINLNALFDQVESIFYSRLESKYIQLSTAINLLESEKIYSNRPVLAEILITLVANSIDALSDLEEKWIKIAVSKQDDNVLFRVIDSGQGLSHDIVEKVFNPLFTTKEIGQNVAAGMGLSVARNSVESIGGKLYYETYDGHTCFVISIDYES